MLDEAKAWRDKMLESVAECDEDIMMMYLEGEDIPEEDIKRVIRQQTIKGEMYPVFCGSAYRNKGVQLMLDGVIDYMPSPLDIPAIKGVNPYTQKEEERPASDKEPFAALAFKIMADPFVGKLAFFRVYSGTLESGTHVYNAT
jgi:elongation factor G